jgi:integrase
MAWLERRNGAYRIVFRLTGARHQLLLGEVELADAKAALHQLEANLHALRRGRITCPEGHDLGAFLVTDASGASPVRRLVPVMAPPAPPPADPPDAPPVEAPWPAITVAAVTAGYLAAQATALEPNSLKALGIQLRHVARTLGDGFDLSRLTLADLQGHIERRRGEPGRRGQPIQTPTLRKEITALGGAWAWAVHSERLTRAYPSKGLRYPRSEERPRFQTRAEIERQVARGNLSERERDELWDRLYLDRDEIDAFVAYFEANAKHRFLAVMVTLAAHTGMRRSEMLRARRGDVDLEAGVITIREKKRVKGTTTTRVVPLSTPLAATLRAWLAAHPGGDSLLARARTDAAGRDSAAGVTKDEADDHFGRTRFGSPWAKVRGFHVLRHSFISACAASGVDVRNVQSWCGHMTPEMSAWYTHLCPATQRTAMDVVFR